MKRLILVRHAKTEPLTNASSDFERKLKGRGSKDSVLMANWLIEKRIRPELILTSPAIRAFETAACFAEVYGISLKSVLKVPFIYDGFNNQRLIDELESVGESLNCILLVGHNPDIAMSAMQFTNDRFLHFPTAAVAALSFSVSNWRDIKDGIGKTDLFLSPKQLKKK